VSVCVCCVCVTCTCSAVDMHPSIRTYIYLYKRSCMEISNNMVCDQHVPDPNKHEHTLDVVGERPWRLSGSWEHVLGRSKRRRHTQAPVKKTTSQNVWPRINSN